MALTALPAEQRLVEGPIALDVHLRQPDLGAFSRWYQGVPQLAGTIQGSIGIHGTAAALDLKTDLDLQKLGVQGTAEQVEGRISMSGHLAAAPSIQEVRH